MLTPAIRAKSCYPCRCLCRGFEQITRTRPCRRMILHFSHIGLTDGRTFMIPFGRCSRRGGSGGRAGHRYHAPGAHVARVHLAVPSATKQNTKRFRHVSKVAVPVLPSRGIGRRVRCPDPMRRRLMAGELAFFELGVEDWERGKAFYEGLFGWTFAPGPSGQGYQIRTPSIPGGIHGGDKGASPYVFFAVDDIEAACARVVELGG